MVLMTFNPMDLGGIWERTEGIPDLHKRVGVKLPAKVKVWWGGSEFIDRVYYALVVQGAGKLEPWGKAERLE